MILTKIRSALNPKKSAAPIPRPTGDDQTKPTFHFNYRIIQTNTAIGQVTGQTQREASLALREQLSGSEKILFDIQNIQIQLLPICFSCQKEYPLDQLQPFGMCSTCFSPEWLELENEIVEQES